MINSFLKTFGYIICKNAINLENEIEGIYDREFINIAKINSNNPDLTQIPTAVNYAIEKSKVLSEKIFGEQLKEIFNSVLSDNYYYWGSDMSTFTTSSDWHRDCNTTFPIYKALIYLDGSYGEDQTFLCIPGTHHVKDHYANRIGKAGKWPSGSGFELSHLNGVIDFLNKNQQATLPSQQIKINRGDIIIFDQRMFHAVVAHTNKKRRLIAISVIPNYLAAHEVAHELPDTEDAYNQKLHEARCAFFAVERGRVTAPMSQITYNNVPEFIKERMLWNKKSEEDYLTLHQKLFAEPESQFKGMRVVNYYQSGK